ncbi:MAG TPA: amidase [Mycobacterium sp.]
MSDQLWSKSATELAGLVRSKVVSATEVVEAHLQRIEDVNPELNAIAVVLADDARQSARIADEKTRTEPDQLGRLHGVPITLKVNIDLVGSATSDAVPAFKDFYPPMNTPLVDRLLGEGAIVVGRTNMSDMGMRMTTDSTLHGLTRNPWHPGRTAGGSSGGEGAALASGMSALGVGNDLVGSLRNPAHCCGISTLKPTPGRIPWADSILPPDGPLSFQMMLVHGPMARQVADVRLGMEIMSGAHPRDPYSVDVPLYRADSNQPFKVAVMAAPPGAPTDPEVSSVVRKAGEAVAAAGYEVDEIDAPEYLETRQIWLDFLMTEVNVLQDHITEAMGPAGRQFLRGFLDHAGPLDLPGYIDLFVRRRRMSRVWNDFFQEYPVIIAPTWLDVAFEHDWDLKSVADTVDNCGPIVPANVLGLPAAVTFGGLAKGMPVGVQCIAAAFHDDQAMQVAEVIEAAVGATRPVSPFINAG